MSFRARLRRTVRRLALTVDPARTTALPPIFVGGTGRSGTTVTARILGAHPANHMVAKEVRFLSDEGGLCDLSEGRTGVGRFSKRVREQWFDRGDGDGLQAVMDRATVEDALDRLRHDVEVDRLAGAAAFTHRLLDPLAVAAGAQRWIEMTPGNVYVAPALLRIFPDMRLVHSVRDGRDVACSVARLNWGPDDLDEALDWWAAGLERAWTATEALPPDRLLVMQMEDLVANDREAAYGRLLAFAGLGDNPVMRAYFDDRATIERAHIGRWQSDVPSERRASFDAHYRTVEGRLSDAALELSTSGVPSR